MFTLGAASVDREECQEVTLQENSASLDLLLRFIDPKKANPKLNLDVIPGLLEAGRKYQIDTLGDWVHSWIYDYLSALGSKYQMVQVVEIGTMFEFPHLCRMALCALIKAPSNELMESNASRIRLYDHLMRLRTRRVEWFREEISKIVHGGAPIRLLKDHTFIINDLKYVEIMQTLMKLVFEVASEPSFACVARYWPKQLYNDYIHGSEEKMELLKQAAL
ncbi:hypothetical protein FRC17_003659, partial [Serendipita sp. 399]